MLQDKLLTVIMAGGAGTRFWPLSTQECPKQFLKLFGERSLLQQSFDRMAGLVPPERIWVLTNESFAGLVREQLPQLPADNIVGEPMRRDTAAAVCLSALLAHKRLGSDTVIVTVAADHLIEPVDKFQAAIRAAAEQAAKTGALYTFGIKPTYPATGYGYLKMGEPVVGIDDHYKLANFREKPAQTTAEQYLRDGGYCWNSGMFAWRADSIIAELEAYKPEHVRLLAKAVEADGTEQWDGALRRAFEKLEPISIDFAVMEKARDVRCITSDFNWSDVGGWLAMKELLPADVGNNRYNCPVCAHDSHGNLVFSSANKDEQVMLLGVENLVVVRAGNHTLVAHQDRLEDVKLALKKLEAEKAGEVEGAGRAGSD